MEEIIRYKFNKKEILYWIIATIALGYFSIRFFWLFGLLITPIAFVAYYYTNVIRCREYNKLIYELSNSYNAQYARCTIELNKERYEMGTKIGMVKIKPLPEKADAIYIQSKDFFILFFAVLDFGQFKKYYKPLVFLKPEENQTSEIFEENGVKIMRKYSLTYEKDYIIIDLLHKHNIKTIKLPKDLGESLFLP